MLAFDTHELLPVVAQDRISGEIRMVAYANRAAVSLTLETGKATFFSRSRGELWEKGKTSGNVMRVASVLVDCDEDAIVYLVSPEGPTCHTGAPSCFFRRARLDGDGGAIRTVDEKVGPAIFLEQLEAVLEARKSETAEKSYVRSLYQGGPETIGGKLREEAGELAQAVANESVARVTSEAADVLFHVMVALRARDIPVRAVLEELDRRFGTSGHDEKRARTKVEPSKSDET